MSSTRYMAWATPSVFRVVVDITRRRPGGPETETVVMGPYATKAGARVCKQAQESRYASESDWDVKRHGHTPWVISARVEWAPTEWLEL